MLQVWSDSLNVWIQKEQHEILVCVASTHYPSSMKTWECWCFPSDGNSLVIYSHGGPNGFFFFFSLENTFIEIINTVIMDALSLSEPV